MARDRARTTLPNSCSGTSIGALASDEKTSRVPLERWREAPERRDDDVKPVVQFA